MTWSATAVAVLLAATPTVVQVGTAGVSAQLGITSSMPDASTPGDTLVVGVWYSNSPDGVTVSDSIGDVFAPTPESIGNNNFTLTGQIFTTTIRDAGTLALTATRTVTSDMALIAIELSGVSSRVEDSVTATGLSPDVDGGSVNASAGAALIAWVLAFGTVGDAGAGWNVVTRFQGDLWVMQVVGDAGPYALTAQSEAMPFGDQGAWLSDTISLAPLPIDAGTLDAGPPDAGGRDAGAVDAGAEDAGAHDAGPGNAGGADAGPFDAGVLDAGVGSRDLQTGCGCTSEPLGLLVLFSLALAFRKARTNEGSVDQG